MRNLLDQTAREMSVLYEFRVAKRGRPEPQGDAKYPPRSRTSSLTDQKPRGGIPSGLNAWGGGLRCAEKDALAARGSLAHDLT